MYNINEKFKEWWNSVKNDIRAVVGKPQYFEEINRSVYTFEDTLTFLKKKVRRARNSFYGKLGLYSESPPFS